MRLTVRVGIDGSCVCARSAAVKVADRIRED